MSATRSALVSPAVSRSPGLPLVALGAPMAPSARWPERWLYGLLGLLLLSCTVELGWQLSIATSLDRAAAELQPDTPDGLRLALLQQAPLLQAGRLSLAPGEAAPFAVTYRQPLHNPLTRLLWGPEIAHRALVPPPP